MSPPDVSKPRRFRTYVVPVSAVLAIVGGQLLFHRQAGYTWINLYALGNFEIDPRYGSMKDIPARFQSLNGTRVRIDGVIFSENGGTRNSATQFQVVSEIPTSKWTPPRVQERVFARTLPGQAIQSNGDPIAVCGTLQVNVKHDPISGDITSVYELDVDIAYALGGVSTGELRISEIADDFSMAGVSVLVLWSLRMMQKLIARTNPIVPAVCRTCKYDLRASRERCPECGTSNPDWIQLPRRILRD